MNAIIHWVQIGVFYLAGSLAETPPSTATSYSKMFLSQTECEMQLIEMRLIGDATATKVKTSGVLAGGHYNQIIVTTPVNFTDFGKGFEHHSCIPVKTKE